MELTEIRQLVQTARWFEALGRAGAHPGIVLVTDLDLWRDFTQASTLAALRGGPPGAAPVPGGAGDARGVRLVRPDGV
jgi:hypothetical protein